MWLQKSVNKKKIFLHSKPQKHKVFQDASLREIFLLLNNRQSQIKPVEALKFHVAYKLVEMEFLSNR